jgi:hypothetical protein
LAICEEYKQEKIIKVKLYLYQAVKNYDLNRPWRPIGLFVVEDTTLSRQSAHRWWCKVVSLGGP